MTTLLAIDCTDQSCSVALCNGDSLYEEFSSEPRRHAQLVLPMIRQLLETAGLVKRDLDAIAVAKGPGSFTGLRIALSASQALGYSLGIPAIGISSLNALAVGYGRWDVKLVEGDKLFVGLDARMGEIYCACFSMDANGSLVRDSEDLLLDYENASKLAGQCQYGIGTALALDAFGDAEFTHSCANADIHAADMCKLALVAYNQSEFIPPLQLEPAYLRREEAWQKLDQQGV